MARSDTLETIAILEEQKIDELDKSSTSSPNEFKMFIHCDGCVYYSNGQIVVDQDIRNPELLSAILFAASDLGIDTWDEDNMEVQLNMNKRGECNMALFINHTHCIAGHTYDDASNKAFLSMDPVRLNRRRRLYWNFLWTHSAHVPCPTRAIPDACDALTWFYTDNLISGPKSVVPFSKAECEELLRHVKDFEAPCYANSAAKVAFLSWLLREICSFRNAETYGELPRKELSEMQKNKFHQPKAAVSTHPAAFLRPIIHLIMNFIFFGIPHSYMRLVKQSFEYRGRLTGMQSRWEEYIERLVREYSHFLLISTVLLSATVGLLAVPDISPLAQVAALVSALSSLGSIIVGVFAIWRHQAKFRTIDSFTYLRNAQHNLLGYHGHAMLLSLPPVLLVWAIITFTISTVAYALGSLGRRDTADDISMAVFLVIFVCILGTVLAALYTLSMIWTFSHADFWWIRLRRKLKKLYLPWKSKHKNSFMV
ncbi:hypothetical protein GYMLUDRAFT_38845 [Collybiopsis luxurians FD-317 M1]|nr:hypothetical protein GYMLUDRAFT_38845 [Collybiopsis luxurians FD-317 M1]